MIMTLARAICLLGILLFSCGSLGATELAILTPAASATTSLTPTLTGTATAAAMVTISINGGALGTAISNGSGDWTFMVGTPLDEGQYPFLAQVNSATATKLLRIDRTAPPAPTFTFPSEAASLAVSNVTVTGTRSLDFSESAAGIIFLPQLTLDLRMDGAPIATRLVPRSATAAWSTSFSGLTDGSYVLTATAADLLGWETATTRAFVIDTAAPEAPTIAVPANGALIAQGRPLLSGTCTGADTVEVRNSGTLLGSTSATSAWYFIPSTTLAEGQATFTAVAIDAAGNRSPTSSSVVVTIDTTAPTVAITSPSSPAVSATSSVSVAGTTSSDTTSVLLNWSTGSATALRAGTTWSATATLPQGASSLVAVASDAAGNSATSSALAVTVDSIAPATPVISAPTTGSTIPGPAVVIQGTAEAGSSVTVRDGATVLGSASASTGPWLLIVSLGDGLHLLSAQARDAAGNLSGAATTSVTVDSGLITPFILATPADGLRTRTAVLAIAGTAPTGRTVTVLAGSSTVASTVASGNAWSCTTALLADGTYDIFASTNVVLDGQKTVRVVIDTLPPPVPVVQAPLSGAALSATAVVVSGTRSLDAAEATTGFFPQVVLVVDGVPGPTAVRSQTAGWVITLNNPGEGLHRVHAVATDLAGNFNTSAEVAFTLDTIAPAAPVIASPATGAALVSRRPVITGTSAETATLRLYAGDTLVGSQSATTAWRFVPSTDLPTGSVTLLAVAVDLAGNSATSASVVITIADEAPVITTPTTSPFWSALSTVAISASARSAVSVSLVATGIASHGSPAGTSSSATTAGSGGTWTGSLALAEGGYAVVAIASDAGGNSATSAPVVVVVDRSAPLAPVIATPTAGSRVASVQVTGTCEANATVVISATTGASTVTTWPNVVADASGAWSASRSDLFDGSIILRVEAQDRAGNLSPASTRAFILDTTAPDAPTITKPVQNAQLRLVSPTAEGTAEPGSTVTLTLQTSAGVAVRSASAAANSVGSWNAALGILTDGGYRLSVTATDEVGNTSDISIRSFTVDTLVPEPPTIISPATGAVLAGLSFTASGTAQAGSTVTVQLNGGANATVAATSGTWALAISATGAGQQLLLAWTADTAGNVSSSASSAFILDDGSPTITIVPARTSVRAGERFAVTFYASEHLNGFSNADVLVTGGRLDGLTLSATMGELARGQLVAGTDPTGWMVIRVLAGAAADDAGNPSAQAAVQVQVPNGGNQDSGSGGGCGGGGGSSLGMLLAGLSALAWLSRRRRDRR